ncbi:UNVERIFIED_CONTAM: adenine-specific DNA-methyltransferase [Acetivibrio alkalicellulosi]
MEIKKIEAEISNGINENLQKIKELFPQVIKDGEVDFDQLKLMLGDFVEVGKEKYELTWPGKTLAKSKALGGIGGRTLKFVEEESKNPDTTQNIYIEGDNLEVLKLLQQCYYGKIKMIYIDPPYNTGNDFIFKDDFSMGQKENEIAEGDRTEDGERLVKNEKSNGRYHSNWLNMMYPRLMLAKNLLSDDGVIFISIDDNEVSNLRAICDEIFGEDNFFATLIRRSMHTVRNSSKDFNRNSDFILVYAKSKSFYSENKDNFIRAKVDKSDNYKLNDNDGKGFYKLDPIYARNYAKPYKFTFKNGFTWEAPQGSYPRYSQETLRYMEDNNELDFNGKEPRAKRYLNQVQIGQPPDTFMRGEDVGFNSDGTKDLAQCVRHDKIFSQPKPTKLIKYLINLLPYKENDIILDFFSGSASTAHAVMELNIEEDSSRTFIMVQIPEITSEDDEAYKAGYKNICEIGKERIRRAGEKIKEENKDKEGIENLDIGFKVFRLDDTNIMWNKSEIKTKKAVNEKQVAMYEVKNLENDFVDGASDIDIVYEILLRHHNIPLTANIEKLDTIGDRTYVLQGSIIVCLEDTIDEQMIDKIAELEPVKVIFRDSSFGGNISFKINTIKRLDVQLKRVKHIKKHELTHVVEFI